MPCSQINLLTDGLGKVGQVCGSGDVLVTELAGMGYEDETRGEVGLGEKSIGLTSGPIIDKLDNLILNSLGPKGIMTNENLSANNSASCDGDMEVGVNHLNPSPVKNKQGKFRRPSPSLLPFMGPRCLRFADAINNSVLMNKKRRPGVSVTESTESHAIVSKGVTANSGEGFSQQQMAVEQVNHLVEHPIQNTEGFELSIVLPFHSDTIADSGVRLLLNEESLNDVEGFIEARDDPVIMELEAQTLLGKQQELGVNFEINEELPVKRMINMEVRDRGKLPEEQELIGFQ
jgi:hypothetical protein